MSAPARLAAVRRLSPALALVVLACAAGTATGAADGDVAPVAADAEAQPERPLAMLAGRPALLLPLQRVSGVPGLEPSRMDDELAFALAERRVGAAWTGAADVRRLARQSLSYAADPAALTLPPDGRLRAGEELRDPLASQLRALAALTEARHVVVPLELRPDASGAGAVLRLVLADARGARVLWAGETPAVPTAPAAALPARVAERFADLIAPPLQP